MTISFARKPSSKPTPRPTTQHVLVCRFAENQPLNYSECVTAALASAVSVVIDGVVQQCEGKVIRAGRAAFVGVTSIDRRRKFLGQSPIYPCNIGEGNTFTLAPMRLVKPC